MTRQRYNKTESLNRILRSLQGKAVSQDDPGTVPDSVLSENEVLSDLAELLAGSLPGETFSSPSALLATASEADEGTDNTVLLTPLSHSWAHEYSGIYVSSGTAQQILAGDTWTKISGSFQNVMLNSSEVAGDWDDDRLVVNEVGTYFVQYQVCLLNTGDAATIQMQTYLNDVAQPQTKSYMLFGASGTADGSKQMIGFGMESVPAVNQAIDVRIASSVAITVHVETAQLIAQKMVG